MASIMPLRYYARSGLANFAAGINSGAERGSIQSGVRFENRRSIGLQSGRKLANIN